MIPILIPTVQPRREPYLLDTLRALTRAGVVGGVHVAVTPPDLQPGWRTQGVVCQRGLRFITDAYPDAAAVLVLEDDVLLSRAFTPHILAECAALHEVVTLYLAGLDQYPADVLGRHPHYTGLVALDAEVRNRWYGGQALVLPRWCIDAILEVSEERVGALDNEVRQVLTDHEAPLYVRVPNLVQHRRAESIDPTRDAPAVSGWYRM